MTGWLCLGSEVGIEREISAHFRSNGVLINTSKPTREQAAVSEVQLRELREFVERCGWHIKGGYIDKGISGSKAGRAPRSTNPGLKLSAPLARRGAKELGVGMGTVYRAAQRPSKTYAGLFMNMVRRCFMFKISTPFLIPSRQSSELQAVNEEIAKLAAAKP